MTETFPLRWPEGRPRKTYRRSATFGTTLRTGSKTALTINEAIIRLQNELDALGARFPVLSSNLEPRLDGMPRSGQREPADPGVAVYFQLNGRPHCMPCDTYDRAADNIAAVAAHIEATRKIERHGVASVAEMFTGFASLPPPGAARPWWTVLGIAQTAAADEIRAAHRRLIAEHHPDLGGSTERAAEINAAREAGLQERSDAA